MKKNKQQKTTNAFFNFEKISKSKQKTLIPGTLFIARIADLKRLDFHSDDRIQRNAPVLAAKLEKAEKENVGFYGQQNPIQIKPDWVILDGATRTSAQKLRGKTEILALVVDYMTIDQENASFKSLGDSTRRYSSFQGLETFLKDKERAKGVLSPMMYNRLSAIEKLDKKYPRLLFRKRISPTDMIDTVGFFAELCNVHNNSEKKIIFEYLLKYPRARRARKESHLFFESEPSKIWSMIKSGKKFKIVFK